jgi:hypothetical protein
MNRTCARPRRSRSKARHEEQRRGGLFSYWPYLLLAALLVLIIEWFIFPRMRPCARGYDRRVA